MEPGHFCHEVNIDFFAAKDQRFFKVNPLIFGFAHRVLEGGKDERFRKNASCGQNETVIHEGFGGVGRAVKGGFHLFGSQLNVLGLNGVFRSGREETRSPKQGGKQNEDFREFGAHGF